MPDFLFDITDDGEFLPAEEVITLVGEAEARDQGMKAIGELMAEALPNGEAKSLQIDVKYADGRPIVSLRLQLTTEWHSSRKQ
jgi:hypothetical protein